MSVVKRCSLLFLAAALLLGAHSLSAAEVDWAQVQRALKEQGLYFGQVDGHSGPETLAAVNRFQIRKGLPVTGEVDEATYQALITGAADAAGTVVHPKPTPGQSEPARQQESGSGTFLSTWFEPMVAEDNSQVLTLDELFAETQLAKSPASRKRRALRRVQEKLREAGVYNGQVDGDPGPNTHQALLDYQARQGLAQTAAADAPTLASMSLKEASLGVSSGPSRNSRRRSRGQESDDSIFERTGRSVKKVFRKIF